jgi:minor histocompatibility antigen H13
MLGLGDIIIPGLFLALLLRFDASRAVTPKTVMAFPKPFFAAGLVSYVIGLVTALVVLYRFQVCAGMLGFGGVLS